MLMCTEFDQSEGTVHCLGNYFYLMQYDLTFFENSLKNINAINSN